jgi:hypothetical protein
MKKALSTIILFLCIATFTLSQNPFKRNVIYLEAGGNGLYGSVNYERQLTKQPGLQARIGLGIYWHYDNLLKLPVGINYLFNLKNKKSFIDVGFGVTFIGIDEKTYGGLNYVNFVPGIGYRRHTLKNVMWRISFTPVINKYGSTPWVSASIGKRF